MNEDDLTSKSILFRFSTSMYSMFWWYISWASCATISACGSCSAVPYSMFLMATSTFDVSSEAYNMISETDVIDQVLLDKDG